MAFNIGEYVIWTNNGHSVMAEYRGGQKANYGPAALITVRDGTPVTMLVPLSELRRITLGGPGDLWSL